MKFFFTIIAAISCGALFAQTGYELSPLSSNIVLQKQASSDAKAETARLAKAGINVNYLQTRGDGICPPARSGFIYLFSGDTAKFDISSDTGVVASSIKVLTPTSRNGSLVQDGILMTVFSYISNNNIADTATEIIDFSYTHHGSVSVFDSVSQQVILKDSLYNVFVEKYVQIGRRGGHTYIYNTFPRDTFTSEICIIDSALHASTCSQFFPNNTQIGGVRFTNSKCFVYNTFLRAEKDSLSYQVCNNFGTCDTITYVFSVRGDTLALPFFDDFSYAGPYPDKRLWVDKKVFVNNTMAYQPPSIGVATFDALNENGKLYSSVVGSAVSSADTLTSTYLDLGGLKLTDSVILSFYLQPKGLNYAPGVADSMILEFRNPNGGWDYARSFLNNDTLRVDDVRPFKYYASTLNDPYLYKGFQFRFRNFAKLYGNFDIWHLDYVRLDKNRRSVSDFQDMALSAPSTYLLKDYTAIPWRHLKSILSTEVAPSVRYTISNLFSTPDNNIDSRVSFTELTTGTQLATPTALANGINFAPGLTTLTVGVPAPDIVNTLKGAAFANADSLIFQTQYVIQPNKEIANSANYAGVLRNDTARTITNCTNYFAYDDGTAEIQYSGLGVGTETALQFTATVPDTLRAVQFMFPHVNGDAGGNFNLRIRQDSLTNNAAQTIYTGFNIKPLYLSDLTDSIQGFTTIDLVDNTGKPKGIPIHPGKFYITFQNIGDIRIPIGVDRNNLNADVGHLFLNTSGAGVWDTLAKPSDTIIRPFGAIMIRPVFSKLAPRDSKTLGSNDVAPASSAFAIYPNPATDRLFIELKDPATHYEDYELALFNSLGQLLRQGPLNGSPVSLLDYPAGMYFLKIRNLRDNRVFNGKILISE